MATKCSNSVLNSSSKCAGQLSAIFFHEQFTPGVGGALGELFASKEAKFGPIERNCWLHTARSVTLSSMEFIVLLFLQKKRTGQKESNCIFSLTTHPVQAPTPFLYESKFLSLTFNNQIPITHSFWYHGGHGRSIAEVCS